MDETNSLIQQRRAKLDALRAKGIDPFRNNFVRSCSIAEAHAQFAEGREVAVAGRIMTRRDMGKSEFMHIKDQSGTIQIYAQKNVLGDEVFDAFKHLDLGDIIGVKGTLFTTKTGEQSVRVQSFTIVTKALRPPPEKWHGLQDVEARYRQRYLDLFSNDESRKIFEQRSRIVSEIRSFLNTRGFMEVETPMMQPMAGGAAATPFKTHHDALNCDLFLRIAPELYLKRLLVGGFEKIYEMNRNFRNEGISRRHNPEFTMIEIYEAYGTFETMMALVQDIVCHVAKTVFGTLELKHASGREINLTPPWKRITYRGIIEERVGADWFSLTPEQRLDKARARDIDVPTGTPDYEVTNLVFEKEIEPTLIHPTFVTHLPYELVPLAKRNAQDANVVDVFELIVNGMELAPAYSEQNDPIDQRARFEQQAHHQKEKLDEDFLAALEHGMPPAGGMGIGIDRLTMMLTGAESIRDVVLFPQLRPQQPRA
jgi:lysyl-tRNA synthetase class 2